MGARKLGLAGLGMTLAVVAVCVAYLVGNDAVPAVADSRGAVSQSQANDAAETRVIAGVEFPVNENGMTYGSGAHATWQSDPAEMASTLPDLVAVEMPDCETGYLTRDDWIRSDSDPEGVTNPEEALAWMAAGSPRPSLPIYAEDGVTQIGWWKTVNGVTSAYYL